MKKYLITITSIIALTITNNEFINIKQTITSTNNLQINIDNQQNSLFNNQYHYLDNNSYYWITNQSTIDHKFYSYNISVLRSYSFSDKLNTFLVDTTGNLVYNPNVTIPNKDKLNIENTRQQMITNCKITTIKNNYNPYSKANIQIPILIVIIKNESTFNKAGLKNILIFPNNLLVLEYKMLIT